MALGSVSGDYSGLDYSYQVAIQQTLAQESQPLNRLTEQRDTITVQKGIYTDLNTKLTAFQSSIKKFVTDDPFYSFNPGRAASFSGLSDGVSFGSVSVGSTAIPGDYTISVTNVAQAHSVRSDRQVYANQALGLTGSFLIGGEVARSQVTQATSANTVTAFATSSILDNKAELGTGTYYVETRNDDEDGWQFRLVDEDGNAVTIQKAGADGDYTNGWQSIPTGGGEIDTGRGLKITLGADDAQYVASAKGGGAAEVDYTAQAATIEVESGDTLIDIASMINNADYADGNEVSATIVDNQLILKSKSTGENHAVVASDVSGDILSTLGILDGVGDFKNTMQTARNANFTVNGLPVERSQSTGLTDVINGVTLNLLEDSEGETATLSVKSNADAEKADVNQFITQFNDLTKYLSAKTSTVKNADDTYTRGALAGDMIFKSLRYDIIRYATVSHSTGSDYGRLSDIGITINDEFQLSISDSGKFNEAVLNNRSDVEDLLDTVMSKMNDKVERFLGTSGYLTTKTKAADRQIDNANDQIDMYKDRLSRREEALILKYAELQTQLMTMTYQSQQFGAMFGGMSYYG